MKKINIIFAICILLNIYLINGCIENTLPDNLNIVYVDIHGGKDYTKIQSAIDAITNGGKIIVSKGSYDETLRINKSITLIGSGENNTIIRYTNKEIPTTNMITIKANNCTIKNFKIINYNISQNINGINIKSINNTVSGNSILYFTEGINVDITSKNNFIIDNEIINNYNGIIISDSIENTIKNNTITSNSMYGVYLRTQTRNNDISWNFISNNSYGIRVKSATNNEIYKNILTKNQYGIYFCCGARGNNVYHNNFINNTKGNALDDKYINYWDNGKIGNYWDNYKGIDSDNDGISDTRYSIPGGSNYDHYPSMNPLI